MCRTFFGQISLYGCRNLATDRREVQLVGLSFVKSTHGSCYLLMSIILSPFMFINRAEPSTGSYLVIRFLEKCVFDQLNSCCSELFALAMH